MEDFAKQIKQLRIVAEPLKNITIARFIHESEQIGQQLQRSQEVLLEDIQRLKRDMDVNRGRIERADGLRAIDESTLKAFKDKLEELNEMLTEVKKKETNAWRTIQVLRVSTSRLWHIFEVAMGATIADEILDEDVQKLLARTRTENEEQANLLASLEQEHGDLLLKMKEIQLTVERFRTTILQTTQHTRNLERQIKAEQQINDQAHERSSRRIQQLHANLHDVQTLLVDYKSTVHEVQELMKLIFHVQTELELHQKTTLNYQTKLAKYKQDLTRLLMNRAHCKSQIVDLERSLQQHYQHSQQIEQRQQAILQQREVLHERIHAYEKDKEAMLDTQSQLLATIHQTSLINENLETKALDSNRTLKDLQLAHRQLLKEHKSQQELTVRLHRTVDVNDQQMELTRASINRIAREIKGHDDRILLQERQTHLTAKELLDLENCQSATKEELTYQQTRMNETKANVTSLTHKVHRLAADEKPLMKEITRYQRLIAHHTANSTDLELNLKQNESKITRCRLAISKLVRVTRQADEVVAQESQSLEEHRLKQRKTDRSIVRFDGNLTRSMSSYQNLKDTYTSLDEENKQLKQEHERLTFVIQLLGHRQIMANDELQPLHTETKRLADAYPRQAKIIEQYKSDLNILRKHYHHLRAYNRELQQATSLRAHEQHECLHSQELSHRLKSDFKTGTNSMHHWHVLKIQSPAGFDDLSKLFAVKKKLVQKGAELSHLRRIFHEKQSLYRHLNDIHCRRQALLE